MKSTLLGTVLVAAVVGSVSAVVASFVLQKPSSSDLSAALAPSTLAPEPSDPALLSQLRALRDENLSLRLRVEALEERPLAATRAPMEAVATKPSAQEASSKRPDVVSVQQALHQIREEEQAEQERQQEERRAERIEQRLSRLTTELGLTPIQAGEMRNLWATQQAARDELRRERQAGADPEIYRESRQLLRAENEQALSRILTLRQLDIYQAREQRRDRGEQGGAVR